MKLARTFPAAVLTAICLTSTAFAGTGMLGVYLSEDDSPGGALVEEVASGSPAEHAGLRKGDRILRCDGKATPTSKALIPHLVNGDAGQVLRLRVLRDGWEKTFKVRLAAKKASAAPAPPRSRPARSERGFLGVYLRQNDAGNPVIDGVMAGSPAEKAGLRVGDTVQAVDGRPVTDPSGLIAAVGRHGAGDSVTFTVQRGSKPLNLTATLARRGSEHAAPTPEADPARPTPAPRAGGKKPYIGVALVDNNGAGPLKVDDVQANSPAERFGLRPQDVILSANHKPLKSIEDFVKALQGLRPGDVVLLKIERDGWKSDVRLTLGTRPKN